MVAPTDETVSALGEILLEPALGEPAGTYVEGDDLGLLGEGFLPETVGLVQGSFRDGHFQPCIVYLFNPQEFSEHIEMRLHLMLDEMLVGHNSIKKQRKTGLGVPHDVSAPGESR